MYHSILLEEVESAVQALKMESHDSGRHTVKDRHPDLNLQQDLEDRRMANHMDSIPSYHTPQRKAICSCARTSGPSALSAILVRSC